MTKTEIYILGQIIGRVCRELDDRQLSSVSVNARNQIPANPSNAFSIVMIGAAKNRLLNGALDDFLTAKISELPSSLPTKPFTSEEYAVYTLGAAKCSLKPASDIIGELNMTQTEIASALPAAQRTVSRWSTEKATPDVYHHALLDNLLAHQIYDEKY